MEKAHLLDLRDDFPRELRDRFDFETNGNPWYYRWRMSRKPWDASKVEAWEKINEYLIALGFDDNDIIILTDGW